MIYLEFSDFSCFINTAKIDENNLLHIKTNWFWTPKFHPTQVLDMEFTTDPFLITKIVEAKDITTLKTLYTAHNTPDDQKLKTIKEILKC